ncbi:GIY-YIG nuclease family protein [Thermobifida halotolerans]|uniref:GIY-YIG nuclease family protein n=1 Tax=Thermobifida halotolerans TaxID=483545 RepID=A0AA97LZ21_9ACTN|nr:GIY-YIG nuclease family protein [Thermobifida halotolerans]UOE20475.1 GIY-YIG nuclease family protein [Thermobifida halotolerans]
MLDSESGFVYVLTHPRFPELVKVGFTSRLVEERVADLSTAVPEDFTIAFRLTTLNARAVERHTHELLGEHRLRKDKEFFEVTEEQACAAVQAAAEAVNGIRAWTPGGPYRLRAEHRVFLPLRAG